MRAAIAVLLVLGVGFGLVYMLRQSPAVPDTVTQHEDDDVRLAERHEASVRELASALDAAKDNAREAEDIARRLDKAVSETRATTQQLYSLRRDNSAVTTSIAALEEAGAYSDEAARIMRLYSGRLNDGLAEAETLSDQAVEMAEAIEKVEQSQAEAEAAMANAEKLRSKVETTGTVTTDRYATHNADRTRYRADRETRPYPPYRNDHYGDNWNEDRPEMDGRDRRIRVLPMDDPDDEADIDHVVIGSP